MKEMGSELDHLRPELVLISFTIVSELEPVLIKIPSMSPKVFHPQLT